MVNLADKAKENIRLNISKKILYIDFNSSIEIEKMAENALDELR